MFNQKIDSTVFIDWLLSWYQKHKRDLPWRNTKDPYKIWLSEVILQQTRVIQALPYYTKFTQAFPTVQDLSNATEQEVLQLWQGLGYYGRARRLHTCSKYITGPLKGIFPSTYVELTKLPGIGPYTAAAIASIAFEETVPVLDGNVYRVLARLFGLKADITSSQGKKEFSQLAKKLIPDHSPSTYNQALMEFGALHCTPQKPACSTCPFQRFCYAYHTDTQFLLPVKKRKPKVKKRYFHYIVIHFKRHIYLKKRIEKDIWQGLYDFYLVEEKKSLLSFSKLAANPLVKLIKQCKLTVKKSPYMPIHQLTHQRLHTCFFHVYADEDFIKMAQKHLQAVGMQAYQAINKLPTSVLINRFCAQDLASYTNKKGL